MQVSRILESKIKFIIEIIKKKGKNNEWSINFIVIRKKKNNFETE